MKFRFRNGGFSSWFLLPTIRFGLFPNKGGGFLALTWMKLDAVFTWS